MRAGIQPELCALPYLFYGKSDIYIYIYIYESPDSEKSGDPFGPTSLWGGCGTRTSQRQSQATRCTWACIPALMFTSLIQILPHRSRCRLARPPWLWRGGRGAECPALFWRGLRAAYMHMRAPLKKSPGCQVRFHFPSPLEQRLPWPDVPRLWSWARKFWLAYAFYIYV